jgi:hypothetical protein
MNKSEAEIKRYQRYPGTREPEWVPVPKWIRVSLGDMVVAYSRRLALMRGVMLGNTTD